MANAVIFDVDGTLVDSVDAHAEAWRRAFADFGHTFSFEELRGQIGKGGDQLLPAFLDDRECARIGEALEAHRGRLFKAEFMEGVAAFPGAADLLRAIRARGYRTALASSAKGEDLQVYKRKAGIEDLVDVETCSDDAEKSKPHPDIFEAALGRLDLAPDKAVVVGDTPYDAEAAGKAGIRSVGVRCGGFPEADLRRAGAAAVYDGPEDLLARLDDWLGGREPQ